ncbi:hypothetical protein MKS88_005004 [Plasmodium brasilianum]|uniref:Uncharacterized protein n=1 Tax=Plasmodium brasilianum TaxID=5824 RepID=A0ACB9Y3U4_PLABR|nr:hypothetical protein MKS88_005004 [Plasmodium brasilianum]
MESNTYFREIFLYVQVTGEKEEKRDNKELQEKYEQYELLELPEKQGLSEMYFDYMSKCFSFLLNQEHDYIISTLKKNGSLTSFFFSYLLNANRYYDLYFKNNEEREFSDLDMYVFEFYVKLVEIFMNKDRLETGIIKTTFLKIHIFMDIVMLFYKIKKDVITRVLNKLYVITKFHFFKINKYISFLYKELKCIKEKIEKYNSDSSISNNSNSNNPTKKDILDILLFQINEFIVCIYCFTKFFKEYKFYDTNENKLTNDLIIAKLLFHDQIGEEENNLEQNPSLVLRKEGGSSFLCLFIQTYIEMIRKLYSSSAEDTSKKSILFLRYEFAKVLKMFIKYNILYGNDKNKLLPLSIVIDLLTETCNDVSLHFLRNDIRMSKWKFLQNFVVEDKLDFEFFIYVNNFLKIKSKKGVEKMMKKIYENEINQVREIATACSSSMILEILKKNNFNVSNSLEHILNMNQEQMDILHKGQGTPSDASAYDSSNDERSGEVSVDVSGHVSSDEKSVVCSCDANDGKNGGKNRNVDEGIMDVITNNLTRTDNYYGYDKDRSKEKNVLEMLREQSLINKARKKKNAKYKYRNESMSEENKNKILNLLNQSSLSSDDLLKGSDDIFVNEKIIPTSYRKNYAEDEGQDVGSGDSDEEEKIKEKEMNRKKYSEMDRKKYGEMDRKKYGEMDRKKYGEMDRKKYGEMDRKKYGEMDRKKYGEMDRKKYGEMDRKKYGEMDRKKDGEMDRKKYGEMDRKKYGEMDRKKYGEMDRKKDGEMDRKKYGEMDNEVEKNIPRLHEQGRFYKNKCTPHLYATKSRGNYKGRGCSEALKRKEETKDDKGNDAGTTKSSAKGCCKLASCTHV